MNSPLLGIAGVQAAAGLRKYFVFYSIVFLLYANYAAIARPGVVLIRGFYMAGIWLLLIYSILRGCEELCFSIFVYSACQFIVHFALGESYGNDRAWLCEIWLWCYLYCAVLLCMDTLNIFTLQ